MTNVFQSTDEKLLKRGHYASLAVALLTIITFVFAMIAIPISGANAPIEKEFSYPFLNTLKQFPRDFLWQYIALVQLISYLFFITSIKANAKSEHRFYAELSSHFALLATGVLLVNYYCQVMVVPSSLAANSTDGIGLIIQYNPYGLFIALEELGYILMCLSLYALLPLFAKIKGALSIKLTMIISFILAVGSLLIISVIYGLQKLDRFEVAIISVAWISLIVIGVQLGKLFRKEEQTLRRTRTS